MTVTLFIKWANTGLEEHGLESISSFFPKIVITVCQAHIKLFWSSLFFTWTFSLNTRSLTVVTQKNKRPKLEFIIYKFNNCVVLSVIDQDIDRRSQLVAFLFARFISHTTVACRINMLPLLISSNFPYSHPQEQWWRLDCKATNY